MYITTALLFHTYDGVIHAFSIYRPKCIAARPHACIHVCTYLNIHHFNKKFMLIYLAKSIHKFVCIMYCVSSKVYGHFLCFCVFDDKSNNYVPTVWMYSSSIKYLSTPAMRDFIPFKFVFFKNTLILRSSNI